MREHSAGRGQRDSRCGVGTGAVQRGRKVIEAGGSFGQEAGHRWTVAAVLKTTTAEAAEATTKTHAMTHKIHKHCEGLGPSCLALKGIKVDAHSSKERQKR